MDPQAENCSIKAQDKGFATMRVPSILEILKNDSQSVPDRYIREPNHRPGETNILSECSYEIPVIDLMLLINGNEDEQKKLHLACKEWGFFQITNHGLSEVLLKKIKVIFEAFFELPLEEKMKYEMSKEDMEGYGHGFILSDQQKLDWNDGIFLGVLPKEQWKFKYWPLVIDGFKETVEEYSLELYKVAEGIMCSLSILMGLSEDTLIERHGKMKVWMRMNNYPACSRPDLVIGVTPHSDASSITLLLQDDRVTGLQIRHRDGWVPVKPIPNSLVVNVGDVLESWSNGIYKSIEHRVVTNKSLDRMSIAMFFHPGGEADLSPVDKMLEGPAKYKSIKYGDYAKHVFSGKLDGKANIDYLKVGLEDK